MSLASGTKLGRYEIRSKLGEGGMGEVYRATDQKLNRDVAIKVLPTSLATNSDRLHRFEQEAQAAGTLNHPNILAVYDVGVHENAPYVVTELLEGENFRELLSAGSLPSRKAIDYATQIARGLAAAHEKNIIHRDLKPDNLFITKDERVKILDFGLAKLSQPTTDEVGQTDIATRKVHTDPGTVMGTVGYMSPEQVRAKSVDHRSDIFSFGTVLYEMLSGRRAFQRDSAIESLNAILKEEPADFGDADGNISPALERVVLHCLEKNPDRRFQSATDVVFALESLSGVTSHRSQQTLLGSAALPTDRSVKRERWIWATACALLLLLASALAFKYVFAPVNDKPLVKLALATPENVTFPSNITISPNGLLVTFVATDANGKRHLWLRQLDSLKAEPLPATDGANGPFWSPDSHFIAYFSNHKLLKIEISGGRPQTLCDVGEYGGGTWNRDGVILFGGSEGLYRVSAQGGTPVLATKASAKEEAHRWPYFLPDGRHFVFLGDAGTTEDHHIRVGTLDSQETEILFGAISRIVYALPGYLLYVNQGALVTVPFNPSTLKVTGEVATIAERIAELGQNHEFDFSASETGTLAYQSGSYNSQLAWFDRTGKKLSAVGEPAGIVKQTLSPDDKSAAAGLVDADGRESDVWIYDFKRGTSSRLTFDPNGDGTPVWSPDGTRVVFGSNRLHTGGIDLFEKAATGTGEEKLLLQSTDAKVATNWSRNGQFLLFEDWGQQAKCAVWLMNMSGTPEPRPILQSTVFNQGQGAFSPDGQFISYTSDESGRNEVYVQRFPVTTDKWPISSGGGSQPVWGADGHELFYLSEDKKMMAVDVKVGKTFESGMPHQLFEIGPLKDFGGSSYSVTSDGQRFLISSSVEADQSSPMKIVLNWTASLKKK
jgi:eukaryotic-like serine/threonine-protein kinase